MGRPLKVGLDYFPIDLNIAEDESIVFVEAKYGIVAFGILIKLLIKIYRQGYYTSWKERDQYLFLRQTPNIEITTLRNIVAAYIDSGFFHPNIAAKHQILTSHGIQKRYIMACERRTAITIHQEYCCIAKTGEDFPTNNVRIVPMVAISSVNVDHNSVSVAKEISPANNGQDTPIIVPHNPLSAPCNTSVIVPHNPVIAPTNDSAIDMAHSSHSPIMPDNATLSPLSAPDNQVSVVNNYHNPVNVPKKYTEESRVEESRVEESKGSFPPLGLTDGGISPSLQRHRNGDRKLFDKLIMAYPKKNNVSFAETEFYALVDNGTISEAVLDQTIIPAIGRWKSCKAWQEENGQYIPRLERFLHEKLWVDAPQPTFTALPPEEKIRRRLNHNPRGKG